MASQLHNHLSALSCQLLVVFPYLSRSPAGCNDTKRLKYVFWMPHCCRNDINNRLVFHRWLKRPATINFFEQVHWRYVYANVRNIDVMHSTKTSWMIILTSYSRLREALKIFFRTSRHLQRKVSAVSWRHYHFRTPTSETHMPSFIAVNAPQTNINKLV